MNLLSQYVHLDAVEMGALIRSGEIHPREVVTAAIGRIERHDTRINAMAWRRYDLALREAEQPLPDSPVSGVPFLIKDLSQSLAGAPNTMGSRMRRGLIADHDSNLVTRYKTAGLLIVGQSTYPEFGVSADTRSALNGTTRNPWNLDHSPGGSSGGAAAAVAARYLPAAHASDGGGSIRIPSSMCGLFGLKPTRARTPKGPLAAEGWFGMSVDHAVTRTVRDSAALLDISQGPDQGAPYYPPPPERPYLEEVTRPPGSLRIAISTGSMLSDKMHPECERAVENTAELLEDLGHRVSAARPSIDGARFKEAMSVLIAADMACTIANSARDAGRRPSGDLYEAAPWLTGLVGRRLPAVDLVRALRYMRNMGRSTAPFFEDYDVLVEPTIAVPPWKSGTVGDLRLLPHKRFPRRVLNNDDCSGLPPADQGLCRRLAGRWWIAQHPPRRLAIMKAMRLLLEPSVAAVPNTALWNATGQPSMSMPLHWADGLPIGVQFTARYADEGLLFRLAGQIEEARPWIDRLPPLLTGE
ncbi:MAG: amidase [bacterium]|nr:amidase [bacterium]